MPEKASGAVQDSISANPKKKSVNFSSAWPEARRLMWEHLGRLAVGLVLMLISRAASLVMPTTSKYFIDDVIGKHHYYLLTRLAIAGGCATLVQALTSF